ASRLPDQRRVHGIPPIVEVSEVAGDSPNTRRLPERVCLSSELAACPVRRAPALPLALPFLICSNMALEPMERQEPTREVSYGECHNQHRTLRDVEGIRGGESRACPQLSQMTAAAKWIAARKFLAV